MKKIILSAIIIAAFFTKTFGVVHTITSTAYMFNPATLTIDPGDTVDFNIASAYNAVEVSATTWENNGNTSNGGFIIPFGGGKLVLTEARTYYYVCSPYVSMGMKGTITVQVSLGIKDVSGNFHFMIYPNPVNNNLQIKYAANGISKVAIEIYNNHGELVYRSVAQPDDGNSSWNINIGLLPAATYYLSLKNGKETRTEEFVKL